VFCNPPYGREVGKWVEKSYKEAKKKNTTVVMLIPARTDTRYFHDYIYHKAKEIRFIKGRLKFGKATNAAPFPSMVVVFRG
jgi:site-specific DNA-methyltransferase (adenine-specific)